MVADNVQHASDSKAVAVVPSHVAASLAATLVSATLLGLAVVAITHSSLGACGATVLGFGYSNCPGPSSPTAASRDTGGARLAALEAEGEQLERQLRQARASAASPTLCQPEQRADPPASPVPHTPAPTKAAIAPDKWDNQDVSSLEGCWELGSDYRIRNRSSGIVSTTVSWSVCFDARGSGQQRLALSDGAVCQGKVQGRFASANRLEFTDETDLPCDNNTKIFKRDVTCTRQETVVLQCNSHQTEGGGRSDVTLKRK